MDILFVIDLKNYDEDWPRSKRPSVRGIIVCGDRLAMVHSRKYNYYKFPGGGIDEGETREEALIREVAEETGLQVIPETIQEYGVVLRIQKSNYLENTIFEQENFYYFCGVADSVAEQCLDNYEAEEGFTLEYVTAEEAMRVNRAFDGDSFAKQMVDREARVLERLIAEGKGINPMNRPYIICHMTTSVDGKVTGEFLGMPESAPATEAYYEINREYRADAFACGRVTMEESFTGGWQPDLTGYEGVSVPKEDYVADGDARFFAVAFDRRGRIGWTKARIEDEDPGYGDAHIIEVMCEDVSEAYLAYLRSVGVSYIFAGTEEMDLELALVKLKKMFGIHTLLLEGGSVINGAFARAQVIDELSLVVAPVAGGPEDKPLFENGPADCFDLRQMKQYNNSVLWLNYKKPQ